MLILTSAMLSGVHMSTVSFLQIWIKVSKVSNIRLGHVASFQPLRSTTIQWLYTISGLDWWTGLVDWTTGLTCFH